MNFKYHPSIRHRNRHSRPTCPFGGCSACACIVCLENIHPNGRLPLCKRHQSAKKQLMASIAEQAEYSSTSPTTLRRKRCDDGGHESKEHVEWAAHASPGLGWYDATSTCLRHASPRPSPRIRPDKQGHTLVEQLARLYVADDAADEHTDVVMGARTLSKRRCVSMRYCSVCRNNQW
jgi:hypothetical protein